MSGINCGSSIGSIPPCVSSIGGHRRESPEDEDGLTRPWSALTPNEQLDLLHASTRWDHVSPTRSVLLVASTPPRSMMVEWSTPVDGEEDTATGLAEAVRRDRLEHAKRLDWIVSPPRNACREPVSTVTASTTPLSISPHPVMPHRADSASPSNGRAGQMEMDPTGDAGATIPPIEATLLSPVDAGRVISPIPVLVSSQPSASLVDRGRGTSLLAMDTASVSETASSPTNRSDSLSTIPLFSLPSLAIAPIDAPPTDMMTIAAIDCLEWILSSPIHERWAIDRWSHEGRSWSDWPWRVRCLDPDIGNGDATRRKISPEEWAQWSRQWKEWMTAMDLPSIGSRSSSPPPPPPLDPHDDPDRHSTLDR